LFCGGRGERRRMMEGVNLRYIVTTHVNITMYPPVQILYANKIILKINKRIILLKKYRKDYMLWASFALFVLSIAAICGVFTLF
jgi:hypothetical protein